ncbi:hypothetical protein HPB50_004488 [Hyalomma asiaticum]|uniref:Uncharacterized protein n=1 Tax=Hyalomma asiaticum TaxID=266040 RepID=A0ACB7RHP1_HYAAI|nr:hypothetical protein HPB50_004488 [Hyalomma asiaticum]
MGPEIDVSASSRQPPSSGKRRPTAPTLAMYCTLATSWLGCVCVGAAMGYAPSALRTLMVTPPAESNTTRPTVSAEGGIWFTSMLPLGAVVGSLCAGSLCQWVGRRDAMTGCAIAFLVSWLWLHSADSTANLCLAHLVVGFSVGLVSLCASAHMVEVAAPYNRGLLGGGLFVAVTAGALYSHCLGLLLDWSWLAVGCAIPALLFGAVALFAVESPRWLLLQARRESAMQALTRIGIDGARVDREVRHIEEAFTCVPPTAVNVLLVYHVMFVQQFSGIGGVTPNIGIVAQAAGLTLSQPAFTVLLSSLQLVMAAFSAAVMDVVGRHRLFLASAAASICSLFAVGTVNSWSRGKEPHPVALATQLALLVAYASGYSIGLGPVTWLLAAELIPLQGTGLLLSMAFSFNWLSLFAVMLFLHGVRETLSFSGCGFFFSAVTLAGTSLVYWLVPETSGRSLEQILMDVTAEGEGYRSLISRQNSLLMKE